MKNPRDHSQHSPSPIPAFKADSQHADSAGTAKPVVSAPKPAVPSDTADHPAKPGTAPIVASPPAGSPEAKPANVDAPPKV